MTDTSITGKHWSILFSTRDSSDSNSYCVHC